MSRISSLSSDRNALFHRRGTNTLISSNTRLLPLLQLIRTRLPIQKAALLHRTAALRAAHTHTPTMHIPISATALARSTDAWGREVGDVFGQRMLGTDGPGVDRAGFAGFGECVVARVEVLAFFEVLG